MLPSVFCVVVKRLKLQETERLAVSLLPSYSQPGKLLQWNCQHYISADYLDIILRSVCPSVRPSACFVSEITECIWIAL